MEININKNKSIELGDIVEIGGFLHIVIYDIHSEFCYAIVNLKDFQIKNGWKTLDELSECCKLVEKNENLKLEVI